MMMMKAKLGLALGASVLLGASVAAPAGFSNAGSPADVPKATDCALRALAYDFGRKLQPGKGAFTDLFDALQLRACGEAPARAPAQVAAQAQTEPLAPDAIIVCASTGDDRAGDGSTARPFQSLARAVRAAAARTKPTIALRAGFHFVGHQAVHVVGLHGLTIRSFPGERAVVTGSQPLDFEDDEWALHDATHNVWSRTVSADVARGSFDGLRIGTARGVRAKYPNGAPEQAGENFIVADQSMGRGKYRAGWITNRTRWVREWRAHRPQEHVITGADWPSVDWPQTAAEAGGAPGQTGEGAWGEYHMGSGGNCDDVTPPFGYFCARAPPRRIHSHESPKGVVWGPHLPRGHSYSRPERAVVVAWRDPHARWFTYVWKVAAWVDHNQTAMFERAGGFQGAEGSAAGGEWYIENVLEELDEAGEWYFDEDSRKLYLALNHSEAPAAVEGKLRAVKSKVLFNISGAHDVTLRDLEVRDAALTWLDPHGLPSGGDWALQRLGAITAEDTDRLTVKNCLIERVDGIGIMLNGRNRNASIAHNEFAWIGETAIASWGYSGRCLNENCSQSVPWRVGPDGRAGEQPRGTRIVGNIVREIGIFQKQASAVFHAKSGLSLIEGNVFFNGPRALINFNDGFLGGDELRNNLLVNAVRESGDHAAFNSWDRVPYIHEFGDTVRPLPRRAHHNLVLGTYATQEAFDTDDGSTQYEFDHNVAVYGDCGAKHDWGGHNCSNHDELLILVNRCFTLPYAGAFNVFANQTCILRRGPGGYNSDCAAHAGDPTMTVFNNTIATRSGRARVCGQDLAAYQNATGRDQFSRAKAWPSLGDLVAQARSLLGLEPQAKGGLVAATKLI